MHLPARTVMLTADEETRLWRRYRRGDRAAGDAIIRAMLPFAIRKARSFSLTVDEDDLIGAACEGLVQALARFRPSRARFSTYAQIWVKACLCDLVQRDSVIPPSRAPAVSRAWFNVTRASARIRALRGEGSDTDAAVAAEIGCPESAVRQVRAVGATRRLEAPVWDRNWDEAHGTLPTFGDTLASDSAPESEVCETERAARLRDVTERAMAALDPRSREIVRRRVMLDPPDTLEAIATDHDISRERVRQIEVKAMERLRRAIRPRERLARHLLGAEDGGEA